MTTSLLLEEICTFGIGYAAASIDCTAAAVLPFVLYLITLGGSAVTLGIGGLMLGLLILMIAVTVMVGLGRQVMINFLRRSTGMIKMVGSWMMIMAGISLTLYLTNREQSVRCLVDYKVSNSLTIS